MLQLLHLLEDKVRHVNVATKASVDFTQPTSKILDLQCL